MDLINDISQTNWERGKTAPKSNNRPIICVQGLGFVGAAMSVAVANACDKNNKPYFDVIGVDLPTSEGHAKIESINKGKFPFQISDDKMIRALHKSHANGNLMATTDSQIFSLADIVIVSVNLDIVYESNMPKLSLGGFINAIRSLGKYMQPGSLILVETTVPPGTCERLIIPELAASLQKRELPENSILLAHSYERVMPGREYFDSIVNYWRVYAGYTKKAAEDCEAFLSKIINTKDYPLKRLKSTTASEVGKLLENSYRAVNIAFIEEWGRFAEDVGIDLFEVIDAIRMRPTHSNIRQPGFGVGGYCLTKDPIMAKLASSEIFGLDGHDFPFSTNALEINKKMPLVSLSKIKLKLGSSFEGKKILLLGISYRQDIGDTRYSPSETFVREAKKEGAEVTCHDPLVNYWSEMDCEINSSIPKPDQFEVVVFAVPHKEYTVLDLKKWLGNAKPIIFDANNVLSESQRTFLKANKYEYCSIGRG